MKIAVIDLGTNTFHLLIVEIGEKGVFREVFRERRYVHLAENGIETIGDEPYQRGINIMNAYGLIIAKHRVNKVSANGTAALRSASNGAAFIQEVKSKTGINIQTISGDREARLIYKGVRQAVAMGDTPELIMDIGGGSVEFIIANNHELFWAQSFPIGVAVLYKGFHHSEPIAANEINILHEHLEQTLAPLIEILKQYNIDTIIGASGTFDVLSRVMTVKSATKNSAEVAFADLAPMYETLVSADLEARLAMEKIPNHRAKLIVVAVVLLDFVVRKCGVSNIKISSFAMKEGMIQDLIT